MGNAIMTSRQAAELDYAFERNGWTSSDVKKISQGDTLAQILPVVKGLAKVKMVKHIIDCDADPYIPDNWKIEKHKKGGQIEWNLGKITLYLSKKQQGGDCIKGHELRSEMENKPTLNANVLDYLLNNPYLIPGEWKNKDVFFWGTIYCNSTGSLYVRFLSFVHGNVGGYGLCLGSGWRNNCPSVLFTEKLNF